MATVAGHSVIHSPQSCTNLGYREKPPGNIAHMPNTACTAVPGHTTQNSVFLTILQFKLYRAGDLPVWPPAGW